MSAVDGIWTLEQMSIEWWHIELETRSGLDQSVECQKVNERTHHCEDNVVPLPLRAPQQESRH